MSAGVTARPWCIWRSDMLVRLMQTAIILIGIAFMTACTSPSDTTQMQPTAAAKPEVIPTHNSTPVALATFPPTSTPQAIATHTTSPVPTATQTPAPTATSTAVPTPTLVPTVTPVPTPTGPAITIGDAEFAAEIADMPELRSKGLGERDSLCRTDRDAVHLPRRSGVILLDEGHALSARFRVDWRGLHSGGSD